MPASGGPITVVAAAIIRVGPPRQLLAGCRSHPPALAGRWELPGGKVEPGESDDEALRRECREELGIDVAVGPRVGPEVPTAGVQGVMRTYVVTTTHEPTPYEHTCLRWLSAAELDGVDWLDTDRPLLESLRHTLAP